MASAADPSTLASQARRVYTEQLVKGLPGLVNGVVEAANLLRDKPAEHATAHRRRELALELHRGAAGWHHAMVDALRSALLYGVSVSRAMDLPGNGRDQLTLVDDDTIEREILGSRLALAMMDRASWEFSDVRARMAHLERREELEAQDMLRAHVLARIVVDAWGQCGLSLGSWRELQSSLHEAFATLAEGAYHEVNRFLAERQVLPQIDLRPLIRRQHESAPASDSGYASMSGRGVPLGGGAPSTGRGGVGDETRMMTRTPTLVRGHEQAEAVLTRLTRLVGRHLPGFGQGHAGGTPTAASPNLRQAMVVAEQSIRARLDAASRHGTAELTSPALLEPLQQHKQALKRAAATPVERATIEIVALLFQSILTDERLPPSVRVWFARLQMPVLRVAVSEPDFFATVDHPARRLIDRMGACVLGFDASARAVGDALEQEIKRIVQVVEAYPDTGRRVFQTVLVEFERFLEHYFKDANEASRKGVSLAQQVEQREEKAIQYTIELRRMLESVPVQEGVRQFLFQVWADVLAMSALKTGANSEQTKAMKRAAADLIWSAGAKVTREERAEVIRRLPPLLKTLRDGMAQAGYTTERQDERIAELNNALAAAFTAKAAAIPDDRLDELKERLESLEEMLPATAHLQIDESVVLDLSGYENSELEVVTGGGSMPTAAMLAWARELQVGSWFMLDYRDRLEPVQLAWRGLRGQLSLFVASSGRCVLFQRQPLAAFLQAGLLQPAQDESLTVRATRTALAKLDVDPSRLLN
ncbi:MAG: DUF1631 family protein [Gammaproteobacteria bacterium]|uniref:DUF1631 family protein n=1 Tax=Azohydromonas sp. TaxID=1872666 RepID=UPI002B7097CD|nr:DUF1631 family protein [Azohydromonas sp.]HMM86189.1 DUF1631 family protein [Azohydromonas sp.]